jgi:hypothetical protein
MRPDPKRLAARYASQSKTAADYKWVADGRDVFNLVGRGRAVGSVEKQGAKWLVYGEDGEKPLASEYAFDKAKDALLDHLDIADSNVKTAGMSRTAGEVRFIKDRSGDAGEWAFGPPGPNERDIEADFVFNARYLKPLAATLRSSLMALGHTTSAYNRFVKIKSRNVSPDGNLGGKGYIQKIPDMRRQLMNCVEALSALTDTVYDEMKAPHWDPNADTLDPRDREEVKEIIEDAEEIKDDPEAWASGQEDEMDAENEDAMGKTARRVMLRYANGRLA